MRSAPGPLRGNLERDESRSERKGTMSLSPAPVAVSASRSPNASRARGSGLWSSPATSAMHWCTDLVRRYREPSQLFEDRFRGLAMAADSHVSAAF